jgi:hypothetical protein
MEDDNLQWYHHVLAFFAAAFACFIVFNTAILALVLTIALWCGIFKLLGL